VIPRPGHGGDDEPRSGSRDLGAGSLGLAHRRFAYAAVPHLAEAAAPWAGRWWSKPVMSPRCKRPERGEGALRHHQPPGRRPWPAAAAGAG